MEGPSGSYGQGPVPESRYLILNLPTFSTGPRKFRPRNFFPSLSVLLRPSLLPAHACNKVTILGLHHQSPETLWGQLKLHQHTSQQVQTHLNSTNLIISVSKCERAEACTPG